MERSVIKWGWAHHQSPLVRQAIFKFSNWYIFKLTVSSFSILHFQLSIPNYYFCRMANEGNRKLAIGGMGFVCAAGSSFADLGEAFAAHRAPFLHDTQGICFPVPRALDERIDASVAHIHGGARLDRTVKLAAFAAQDCIKQLHAAPQYKVLVNIGSSRGATHTWESEFSRFAETGASSPKASPYSTPGNISSNIAALLAGQSIAVDHSVTCGSGLQAIANSAAWIRSGMARTALAGGAEAPLTPFTRAQMKALKITSSAEEAFPTKPLFSGTPKTGMALGEGAAVFALYPAEDMPDAPYFILGMGLANERGGSPSGITGEGYALHEAMKAALADAGIQRPHIIITHAPGTDKGDSAELSAIRQLFGPNIPHTLTNKHLLGHTLGASGSLSLVLACYLLHTQRVPALPYPAEGQENPPASIETVMVNATGFGGNAVSIVVGKK